jgi:hypothetical protein
MTRSIAVLLLILLACPVGPQVTAQKTPQKVKLHCELTQDDYAVYSALITALGRPEDPEEAWAGERNPSRRPHRSGR